MTGNYSTREFREKLYDDLHVRLRDTMILMCSIFIASIGLNTVSYTHLDVYKRQPPDGPNSPGFG